MGNSDGASVSRPRRSSQANASFPFITDSSTDKSQSVFITITEQSSAQLFLITQATGILAIAIHQLDYGFRGSQTIGIIVWLLTIVLVLVFLSIYIAKACMFPRKLGQELTSDIIELCSLASISVTFGGIVEVVALVCAQTWGEGWGIAAYVLAWINVGLAFVACIGIPYVYLWVLCPGIDGIPPAVLLPTVAAITAASTCGVVSSAGQLSSRFQVPMIIVGYILIGLGLPFALSLIVIYIARLLNGQWPPRAKVPLTYVIVGPLGQAAYAFQILGTSAGVGAFGTYNKGRFITDNSGKIVEAVSILAAVVLWGYGAFWILFCLAETVHQGLFKGGGIRNRGYGLQFWSPVFPWGVFTVATLQFGKLMNAPAWNALSSAFVILLVGAWLVNAALSLKSLFVMVSTEWRQKAVDGH